MKVKRSSLHCRISNFGGNYPRGHGRENDNLCCYFWRIVGKLVFLSIVSSWIIFILYQYFTSPQLIPNTIMVLFLISIVIVPIISIHYIRKIKGEPVKLSCENILYEFLKAKKRKVCPLIEYID